MQNDPYSFSAVHLMSGHIAEIRKFWGHFARYADSLDKMFSGGSPDEGVDPVSIMRPLRNIDPDLMWEFGPAETGHSLCITAEWKHPRRSLARAVIDLAPDLPRWTCIDARTGSGPAGFEKHFAARFGTDCILTGIDVSVGADNKIDLHASGQGSPDEVCNQALMAAGLLLGEQIDRDWFGLVDHVPIPKPKMIARLRGAATAEFDAADFVDRFHSAIEQARAQLSQTALVDIDLDDRAVSLMKINGLPEQCRRPDMITYTTMQTSYAHAAIRETNFASANHSIHGEWFLFLRIPHDGQGDVEQRGAIEEALHNALVAARIGGLMASGHGTEAFYIDIGVTDVDRALSVIGTQFATADWAAQATLHFLDAGLEGHVLPLTTLPRKPQ